MRLFRRKQQHRRAMSIDETTVVSAHTTAVEPRLLLPELTEEVPALSSRSHALKPKLSIKTSTASSGINPVSPLRIFRRMHNTHQHRRSRSEADSSVFAAAAASAQVEEDTSVQSFHRADLQVGRLLGEGGFACVFDVKVKKSSSPRNKKHPKKLALKQLRPELLQDKNLFGRAAKALVQEASIMEQLRGHKNILHLRGISGDADESMPHKRKGGFDAFFLITDALRETMVDRMAHWTATKRSLSPQKQQQQWMYQLNYVLQIAQALSFCHEQRIIYRDTKCENVGFIDEHTIQLFDFGLARALPEYEDHDDCETVTSSLDSCYGDEDVYRMTICGTQRWMAPEVYNRGWYSTKADVYSWSMTAVELLTQKKPHSYMSLSVHKILVLEGGGRPSVGEFPAGLQLILQQAWAHNVEDRWSMAQVCAALEAYIGSECSQQSPPLSPVTQGGSTKEAAPLQDQAQTNNLADVQQQPTATENLFLASAA